MDDPRFTPLEGRVVIDKQPNFSNEPVDSFVNMEPSSYLLRSPYPARIQPHQTQQDRPGDGRRCTVRQSWFNAAVLLNVHCILQPFWFCLKPRQAEHGSTLGQRIWETSRSSDS